MVRVAKALIYDPEGYALVLRRSGTHPSFAFDPDLPGGLVESNESFTEGLARELQEEIGVDISGANITLVETASGLSTKQLFAIQLPKRPTVTLSWEHDQYAWVAHDQLPAALEARDRFMGFARKYVMAQARKVA